eukprot:scaffold565_cov437-Pavlova_lutheri.AAC.2
MERIWTEPELWAKLTVSGPVTGLLQLAHRAACDEEFDVSLQQLLSEAIVCRHDQYWLCIVTGWKKKAVLDNMVFSWRMKKFLSIERTDRGVVIDAIDPHTVPAGLRHASGLSVRV